MKYTQTVVNRVRCAKMTLSSSKTKENKLAAMFWSCIEAAIVCPHKTVTLEAHCFQSLCYQ